MTTTTTGPPALLADLAGSWLISLTAEGKSPRTISLYSAGVAAFIRWHQANAAPDMQITVADLDKRTASAFLADLLAAGAAPGTARARHAALRRFSAWLYEDGETDVDVLLSLRPPKAAQAPVDSISGTELTALIKACKPPPGAGRWALFEALRDEAVVRLLADTGARAAELIAMTVDDVDLRGRVAAITRGKGGKRRLSAFSAETAKALDRYLRKARRGHKLAGTPRLWLGTSNRGWGYAALQGMLAKRGAFAGIKGLHPHRLRHTATSALLDAGVAEGDVLSQMGWSNRAMLDRYVADTANRRAAENINRHFDGQGQ